jgi:hypothetical protein
MAPAFGALPPIWQGVAEIKAILNDPQLATVLDSGEILESIERSGQGWMITTSQSEVRVEVIAQKMTMPGPELFRLNFVKSQRLPAAD